MVARDMQQTNKYNGIISFLMLQSCVRLVTIWLLYLVRSLSVLSIVQRCVVVV